MGSLDITIKKGEGGNILCRKTRKGTMIPRVSEGSRSQAARVAEIKTNWKRIAYQSY